MVSSFSSYFSSHLCSVSLASLSPSTSFSVLELLQSSVLGSTLLTLDLMVKMVLPMIMVLSILYPGVIPKYTALAQTSPVSSMLVQLIVYSTSKLVCLKGTSNSTCSKLNLYPLVISHSHLVFPRVPISVNDNTIHLLYLEAIWTLHSSSSTITNLVWSVLNICRGHRCPSMSPKPITVVFLTAFPASVIALL